MSEKTYKRVQKAIQKLGYCPNLLARGLSMSSTFSVGILISSLENPIYIQSLNSCNSTLISAQYNMLLGTGITEKELLNSFVFLAGKQSDGMIIFPADFSVMYDKPHDIVRLDRIYESYSNVLRQQKRQCPIIVVGNYLLDYYPYARVILDYAAGANLAAEVLYQNGHRKVGILSHVLSSHGIWKDRYEAYMSAWQQYGYPISSNRVIETTHILSDARRAVSCFLEENRDDLPTAIYCSSDMMALGALQAIEQAGLSVPNDISLIGHDGISSLELVHPKLTTISIDAPRLGEFCAQMLLRMIRDEEGNSQEKRAYEDYYIAPRLIEGETVKKIEQ